jgi:hypothetical protein
MMLEALRMAEPEDFAGAAVNIVQEPEEFVGEVVEKLAEPVEATQRMD